MSRTYRAVPNYYWSWKCDFEESITGEYLPGDRIVWSWYPNTIMCYRPIDPKSTKGKRIAALRRRDKISNCKEPGPSWFRRLFTQRPYRQEAKREIHNFMVDETYEPMILSKPKLEYWT